MICSKCWGYVSIADKLQGRECPHRQRYCDTCRLPFKRGEVCTNERCIQLRRAVLDGHDMEIIGYLCWLHGQGKLGGPQDGARVTA